MIPQELTPVLSREHSKRQDNRGNIYVRSNERKNRGKILYRRENMRLLNNGQRLLDAFEKSITVLDLKQLESLVKSLDQIWEKVEVRIL